MPVPRILLYAAARCIGPHRRSISKHADGDGSSNLFLQSLLLRLPSHKQPPQPARISKRLILFKPATSAIEGINAMSRSLPAATGLLQQP